MINPWKPARRDPDLERIEQLYREYRLPLWRYAFKLLHDEHLADDVVQSVFIKAIEKSELISSLDLPAAETPPDGGAGRPGGFSLRRR